VIEFLLIISIFGTPVLQTGPFDADQCTAQKAYAEAMVDQQVAFGDPVIRDGRIVTRDDVQVDCVPKG
jgi:hypothetical protein